MKKLLCAAAAAVMVISSTVVPAAGQEKYSAQTRPDFTIVIDGEETWFKSASGDSIYPILYNDTTYLPLRSIGEIMGRNVNWDEKTKTITLSGERDSYGNTSKKVSAKKENVEIEVRKDFTIIIDGTEYKFRDANGNRVYPILWEGSTYLPLRSIGEIMGSNVDWDDDTKTITLKGTKTTVTDADTFTGTKDKDGYITEESAKRISAKDADAVFKDVNFLKAKKEYDDGKWQYDVEFIYEGYVFDYTIDAKTGKILSRKSEAAYGSSIGIDAKYTLDEAKKIALKDAGAKEKDVTYIKAEKDYNKGVLEYKIEFRYDGYKYEYKIDASNGKIISKETEKDKTDSSKDDIGLEAAKKAAVADAGLKVSDVRFIKAEKDYDDGKVVYEIEFVKGGREYEYKISADSGRILDKDVDYDDDYYDDYHDHDDDDDDDD